MLTEADGSTHGAKRGYLKQPEKWRAYDPALFDALANAPEPARLSDLQRVEADGVVPSATFFNEFVPDARIERASFHARCITAFADRDLVFFDPDNGLEVKSAKGRRRSKYVLLDEVAGHYGAGRSILVYQHYGKTLPRTFVREKATRLRTFLSGASVSAFATRPTLCSSSHATREHEARAAAVERSLEQEAMVAKVLRGGATYWRRR